MLLNGNEVSRLMVMIIVCVEKHCMGMQLSMGCGTD